MQALSTYSTPVLYAALFFPIIAFVFTLPYIIIHYKKYGSVPLMRSVIVYSFILYLICLYFLVILPLPNRAEVAKATGPFTQLVPFTFVTDFITHSGFVLSSPATWLSAMKNSSFYTVAFNLVLFLPMGIYLRYYFRCRWFKTLIICFFISLFCELTQLSGLYFIYPKPYRLFDVDDLMINTLGGMVGFWLTPILTFFLPKRSDIDRDAYRKGSNVPILRRLLAFLTDWTLLRIPVILLQTGIASDNYLLKYLTDVIITVGYFSLIPTITHGKTLGKAIFKMKLVDMNGNEPKFPMYLLRYFLLIGVILNLAEIGKFLSDNFGNIGSLLTVLCGLGFFVFCCEAIFRFFSKKKDFFYDKLSKTHNISTIDPNKQTAEA